MGIGDDDSQQSRYDPQTIAMRVSRPLGPSAADGGWDGVVGGAAQTAHVATGPENRTACRSGLALGWWDEIEWKKSQAVGATRGQGC